MQGLLQRFICARMHTQSEQHSKCNTIGQFFGNDYYLTIYISSYYYLKTKYLQAFSIAYN